MVTFPGTGVKGKCCWWIKSKRKLQDNEDWIVRETLTVDQETLLS